MRTLLVDDSAPVRRALAILLAGVPGVDVIGGAADAEAAISTTLETRPDLIVVDIRLGATSGLSVVATVALLHPLTKIIVLTNHSSARYRERCISAGAGWFFDKSSDIELFLATCRRLAADTIAAAPSTASGPS